MVDSDTDSSGTIKNVFASLSFNVMQFHYASDELV